MAEVTSPNTSAVVVAENESGHGFGTLPVFLAAISTILGAVMFLRFGYAVANVGWLGAIAIILLGHMVTIPTALAIAEIATNRKVEGEESISSFPAPSAQPLEVSLESPSISRRPSQ